MQIVIESTDIVTEIDGVLVRLWRGTTADGSPCEVFVHRVGSDDPNAQRQLAAVLREMPRPVAWRRSSAAPGPSTRGTSFRSIAR